jgi:hypothetical protein
MSAAPPVNRVLEGVWRKQSPTEKWGAKFSDGTLILAGIADDSPCGRTPPPIGSVLFSVNNVEVTTFADVAAALQGKDEARVMFLVPCKTLVRKTAAQEPIGLAFPADPAQKPQPQMIKPDSPASRAGIAVNSLIIAVDGTVVKDVKSTLQALSSPSAASKLVPPGEGLYVEFISPESNFANVEVIPDASGQMPSGPAKDAQPPLNVAAGSVMGTEATQVPPRPFTELALEINKNGASAGSTLGITFNRATGQVRTVSKEGLVYHGLKRKVSSAASFSNVMPPSGDVPGQWLVDLYITHVNDSAVCYDGSVPNMAIAQLVSRAGAEYVMRFQSQPLPPPASPPSVEAGAAAAGSTPPNASSATRPPSGSSTEPSTRRHAPLTGRPVFASAELRLPAAQHRPYVLPLLQPSPVPSIDFLLNEAVGTMSSPARSAAKALLPQWLQMLKSGLVFDAKDLFDASADSATTRPVSESSSPDPASTEKGTLSAASGADASKESSSAAVSLSPITKLLRAGVPAAVVERICPFGDDSLHCLGWARRCIVNLSTVVESGPGCAKNLVDGGYGTLLSLPVDVLCEDGVTVAAAKETVAIVTSRAALGCFLSQQTNSDLSAGGATPPVSIVVNRLGARSQLCTLTTTSRATDGARPIATTTNPAPETSPDTTSPSLGVTDADPVVMVLQGTGDGAEDLVLLVPSSPSPALSPSSETSSEAAKGCPPLFGYGAFVSPVVAGDVAASRVAFSPFGGRVLLAPSSSSSPSCGFGCEGEVEVDPGQAALGELLPGSPLFFQSRVSRIVLGASGRIAAPTDVSAATNASSPPAKKSASGKKGSPKPASDATLSAPQTPAIGAAKLRCVSISSFSSIRFRQIIRAGVQRK